MDEGPLVYEVAEVAQLLESEFKKPPTEDEINEVKREAVEEAKREIIKLLRGSFRNRRCAAVIGVMERRRFQPRREQWTQQRYESLLQPPAIS